MRATWMACLSKPKKKAPARKAPSRKASRRRVELATDDDYEDASEGYEGVGTRLRHKGTGEYRYVYGDEGGRQGVRKKPAAKKGAAPKAKKAPAKGKAGDRTWAEWLEQSIDAAAETLNDLTGGALDWDDDDGEAGLTYEHDGDAALLRRRQEQMEKLHGPALKKPAAKKKPAEQKPAAKKPPTKEEIDRAVGGLG